MAIILWRPEEWQNRCLDTNPLKEQISSEIIEIYNALTIYDRFDALGKLIETCREHGEQPDADPAINQLKEQALQFAMAIVDAKNEQDLTQKIALRNRYKNVDSAYMPWHTPAGWVDHSSLEEKNSRKSYVRKVVRLEIRNAYGTKFYKHVNRTDAYFDAHSNVHYLNRKEREKYRVFPSNQKLMQIMNTDDNNLAIINVDTRLNTAHGEQGTGIFVISPRGEIFIGNTRNPDENKQNSGFFHSSFLAGSSTFFAGRIRVNDGNIAFLQNYSGHYRSSYRQSLRAFAFFRRCGLLLNNVVDAWIGQITKVEDKYKFESQLYQLYPFSTSVKSDKLGSKSAHPESKLPTLVAKTSVAEQKEPCGKVFLNPFTLAGQPKPAYITFLDDMANATCNNRIEPQIKRATDFSSSQESKTREKSFEEPSISPVTEFKAGILHPTDSPSNLTAPKSVANLRETKETPITIPDDASAPASTPSFTKQTANGQKKRKEKRAARKQRQQAMKGQKPPAAAIAVQITTPDASAPASTLPSTKQRTDRHREREKRRAVHRKRRQAMNEQKPPAAAIAVQITISESPDDKLERKDAPQLDTLKTAIEALGSKPTDLIRELTNLHAYLSENPARQTLSAIKIVQFTNDMLGALTIPISNDKLDNDAPHQKQQTQRAAIELYQKKCLRLKKIDCAKKILTIVAGIAVAALTFVIGSAIGIAAGIWSGPGAAVTGMFGAKTGVSIGITAACAIMGTASIGYAGYLLFKPIRELNNKVENIVNAANRQPNP
jgi:hypothetical protein